MSNQATYTTADGIGWIDLDDGKVNVMSPAMQASIHAALDQAERDGLVTVVRGRPGVFSAGFDLGILGNRGTAAGDMVTGGFELARRVLAHPRPVVMACTGHAIAMGTFLLLSGDYRVAVSGPAKLSANEVAIGLTLPRAAAEILRDRLTPSAFQRATLLAETFGPAEGAAAGFLDEVVDADAFDARVLAIATGLGSLDEQAQLATKRRIRAPLIERLDDAISVDRADYRQQVVASTGTSR